MSQPPSFPLYSDDFLGGVTDMTQQEIGAYILLLCYQWNTGAIPSDPKRQRLIAKGRISARVLEKFDVCPDGQLRNARLEETRQEQTAYRNERSDSGRRGAMARWGNRKGDDQDIAQPLAKPIAEPCESQWQNDGLQSPVSYASTSIGEDRPVERPSGMPTLEQVLAFAKEHAITSDCAEKWFWNHEAENWIDKYKRPIANWRASLRGYWRTWAENERRATAVVQSKAAFHGNQKTNPSRSRNTGTANEGRASQYKGVNEL